MSTLDSAHIESPAPPWWRVGMVWLVVGGPLTVVVAACVTAVIAIRGADIVIGDGAEGATPRAESSAPAMQARNHAATAPEKR
jgi:hypothetical protein